MRKTELQMQITTITKKRCNMRNKNNYHKRYKSRNLTLSGHYFTLKSGLIKRLRQSTLFHLHRKLFWESFSPRFSTGNIVLRTRLALPTAKKNRPCCLEGKLLFPFSSSLAGKTSLTTGYSAPDFKLGFKDV